MTKKRKEEDNFLEGIILDYIQKNGWSLRQQYKLVDIKVGKDPLRLILVTGFVDMLKDFVAPEYNKVPIPFEIEKMEMNSMVVLGDTTKKEIVKEKNMKEEIVKDILKEETVKEEIVKSDTVYHHEFSEEIKKLYNMTDTIGPQMSKEDIKGQEKEEALKKWKLRNKSVKIVDGE